MEAENGFQLSGNGEFSPMRTVPWQGNWDKFSQKFETAAYLYGIGEAVALGQAIAEGKKEWPITAEHEPKEKVNATKQSQRLASMLILSLIDTVGAQQSIMTDRLRYSRDGVRAWVEVINNFERSSEDLKVEQLLCRWDAAKLEQGDYPDQLWARLSSIRESLIKFNEPVTERRMIRRFVASIEAAHINIYGDMDYYRGHLIDGSPCNIKQLRGLLAFKHESRNMNTPIRDDIMKGFSTVIECKTCGRKGHND